jgi:hypothetical protein
MAELSDDVGHGILRGAVEVDQVYARYQHEGLDLRHPEGGQAKYLEAPLYQHHGTYVQKLADHVLAGDLPDTMARVMEDLSLEVYDKAPLEFGDLKASGHPTVVDNGTMSYDRPPNIHRLTPEELRIKAELRALGLGNDYA